MAGGGRTGEGALQDVDVNICHIEHLCPLSPYPPFQVIEYCDLGNLSTGLKSHVFLGDHNGKALLFGLSFSFTASLPPPLPPPPPFSSPSLR